jgi:hypothetical protein
MYLIYSNLRVYPVFSYQIPSKFYLYLHFIIILVFQNLQFVCRQRLLETDYVPYLLSLPLQAITSNDFCHLTGTNIISQSFS